MKKYREIIDRLLEGDPSNLNEKRLGVTEADVAALEGKLGFKFPLDYREFFLEFGGLQLSNVVCPLKNHRAWGDVPVSGFYEINYPLDLLEYYELYQQDNSELEAWFVPIGDVQLSLQFFMSLGHDYGHIYLWDKFEDGWPNSANFFPVANSFDEFIRSLYRVTESG